jgi:hypothetical protein
MDLQSTFSLDETADGPAWINEFPEDNSTLEIQDPGSNFDVCTGYNDPFNSIFSDNTDPNGQTLFLDSHIQDPHRYEVLDPSDATISFPHEVPGTSQVAATSTVNTKPQPRW